MPIHLYEYATRHEDGYLAYRALAGRPSWRGSLPCRSRELPEDRFEVNCSVLKVAEMRCGSDVLVASKLTRKIVPFVLEEMSSVYPLRVDAFANSTFSLAFSR
jgi:hypothetical protein